MGKNPLGNSFLLFFWRGKKIQFRRQKIVENRYIQRVNVETRIYNGKSWKETIRKTDSFFTDRSFTFKESSPLPKKNYHRRCSMKYSMKYRQIQSFNLALYTGYISSRHSVGRKTISIGRKTGEVSRPTLSIYSRVEDRAVATVLEIDSEPPAPRCELLTFSIVGLAWGSLAAPSYFSLHATVS